MRDRILIFAVLAGLMTFAPSALAAGSDCGCCSDKVCTMSCCNEDRNAAAVLLPSASSPARQVAVVWFKNPVLVGDSILMGKYIIEHDNERMANGEPCTHIYAADRPQVPVVKFHCTHLAAAPSDRDLVTLRRTGDTSLPAKLTSFQFAGETAAHGVPPAR
jgi:hypothetical protein